MRGHTGSIRLKTHATSLVFVLLFCPSVFDVVAVVDPIH